MPHLPHFFAAPDGGHASRRAFLKQSGGGFGLLALLNLLESNASGAEIDAQLRSLHPLAPRPSHFPAKARSVIWLFMNGGQSQVDTWDYKPELEQRDGQELDGIRKNDAASSPTRSAR